MTHWTMDDKLPNVLGNSTKDALIKLRDDIRLVIEDYIKTNPTRISIIRDIISFSSEKVLLSGVAYTITFIYIICLILTYYLGVSVQAHAYLIWEALFLFIILVVNFVVAFNEEYLHRNEIPHRVSKVLDTLDEAIEKAKWKQDHYPHLCAPFSPCVILQWTYRDATIVNLPWALLVEGDVIVLRPGQEVPGHCKGLQPDDPELFFGQTFQPSSQYKENFSVPRVRVPHQNKAYKMCETPYLKNLKLALEQATARPVTVFEKQRYLCTVKIMEGIVLPLVISVVVIASFIRHVYQLPGMTHWTEIYFLQTIAASLPLLQIVFPIAWVTLNCYGLATFKLLSETRQKYVRPKSCSISEDASDPLIQALSESSLKVDNIKSIGKIFCNILFGREDMVTRTANIVHVLGSLSALCCVDKKGVLSWPNPTAEKVFFLRNSDPTSHNSSKTSLVGSMGHQSNMTLDQPGEAKNTEASTIAEVLDLTHDQNAPFSVEFDDQRWRQHLALLKPLGLAARLNTCAPAPAPRHTYAHFCAHLTCEAQLSEHLVPVTNRRCLCELAKQIGFNDSVTDSYTVQDCLSIFRHLQADTLRRETRFVRSLQLSTRVKVPLPHMLAVLVKDHANQLQMLTQGTADIVLDSCVDYWNGRDLTPISPSDRKKIIDFYQRNSLTAYCTAFAYKPLTRGIQPELAHAYLELPADSRALYAPHDHWADAPALHFHSTDSLLFNEVTDDDVKDAEGYFDLQCNQVFIGMVTMQYQAQSDMVELIERLERACIRFVHFSKENELRSRVFSEKMGLESGWNCHISLMSDENISKSASPLSSQTLAAHGKERASLARPYRTYDAAAIGFCYSHNIASSKALSMSAPGAINLDHTTVKFDSEIKKARHSITTGLKAQRSSIPTSQPSADSLLEGEEQEGAESPADACRSLSCLTDSTDHSAPLNFDMSNRAKLPRGIENIRPHIEQVDNVPLLVSLFTDCTARSVQLMTQIMQDYGEVVCVMGSAANCLNMEIFMQADASIAVEPLYPVLCQKMPPYLLPDTCIGPIDLARTLNSVPCSLSLQNKWQTQGLNNYNKNQRMTRDADVSLFTLITMSRHYMMCLWNSTQFWICSMCFLALLQMGSLCGFLPLALSVGGAAWGAALCVPLLGAALAFAPLEPAVMTRAATRPATTIDFNMAIFVFWCYACKFLPSVIAILCLYGFTLRSFCEQIAAATNVTGCWIVYPVNVGNFSPSHDLTTKSWHGWGDDFYDGFYLAQHITLALITLHLIVISLSFVHRHSSIWQRKFWTNRVWCGTVVFLLLAQGVFSAVMLRSSYGYCARWALCSLRLGVPAPLALAYAASLLLVFALNEFIKWQEIKADIRNQRRARLDFGTKLGMNSPF